VTEGMVVMDALGLLHEPPNALVVTSARHDVFMSMLMDALEA
jgi:inosine-uridine nucleoside N-ribohydrolase